MRIDWISHGKGLVAGLMAVALVAAAMAVLYEAGVRGNWLLTPHVLTMLAVVWLAWRRRQARTRRR